MFIFVHHRQEIESERTLTGHAKVLTSQIIFWYWNKKVCDNTLA